MRALSLKKKIKIKATTNKSKHDLWFLYIAMQILFTSPCDAVYLNVFLNCS